MRSTNYLGTIDDTTPKIGQELVGVVAIALPDAVGQDPSGPRTVWFAFCSPRPADVREGTSCRLHAHFPKCWHRRDPAVRPFHLTPLFRARNTNASPRPVRKTGLSGAQSRENAFWRVDWETSRSSRRDKLQNGFGNGNEQIKLSLTPTLYAGPPGSQALGTDC